MAADLTLAFGHTLFCESSRFLNELGNLCGHAKVDQVAVRGRVSDRLQAAKPRHSPSGSD